MIKERRKKKRLVKRGIALTMAITLVLGAGVIGIAQSIASVANQEDLTVTVAGLSTRVTEATSSVSGLSSEVTTLDDDLAVAAAKKAVDAAETAIQSIATMDLTAAQAASMTVEAAVTAVEALDTTAISDLSSKVSTQATNLETLSTDITNAIKKANETLTTLATEEVDAINALNAELQTLSAEGSGLAAQVSGLQGNVTTMSETMAVLAGLSGRATVAKNVIDTKINELTPVVNTTPPAEDGSGNGTGDGSGTNGGSGTASEASANADLIYPEQAVTKVSNELGAEVSLTPETNEATGREFGVTLETSATAVTETASHTVLVLDNSSSINEAELTEMKAAAKAFVANMDEDDKVAILTATDVAGGYVVNDNYAFYGVESATELNQYIDTLTVTTGATTAMEATLDIAKQLLAADGVNQNVVILSDGGFTITDATLVSGIQAKATVYTIGYDEAVTDETKLRAYATQDANNTNAKIATDDKAVEAIVNAIEASSKSEKAVESIKLTLGDGFVTYNAENVLTTEFTFLAEDIAENGKLVAKVSEIAPKSAAAVTGAKLLASATIQYEGDVEATVVDVTNLTVNVKAETGSPLNETPTVSKPSGVNGLTSTITIEEETLKNSDAVGVNKNTNVSDFDDRDYMIDLQAWSERVTQEQKPASVVLVVDTSGSLSSKYNNRTDVLQKSVLPNIRDFIDAMKGTGSEIAVVDFDWQDDIQRSEDADKNTDVWDGKTWLTETGNTIHSTEVVNGTRHSGEIGNNWANADDWKEHTDDTADAFKEVDDDIELEQLMQFVGTSDGSEPGKMVASGSTALNCGLEAANAILATASNPNQYVILFTDGVPTLVNANVQSQVSQVAAEAEVQAQAIAARNNTTMKVTDENGVETDEAVRVEIFGIGYGLDLNIDDKILTTSGEGISGNDFLPTIVHDYSKVYNPNELTEIFNSLSSNISGAIEIPATIVDEIDSRFEMDAQDMLSVANQFYDKQGSSIEATTLPTSTTNASGDTIWTWTCGDEDEMPGSLEIKKSKDEIFTLTWSGSAAELTRKEDGKTTDDSGNVVEEEKKDLNWFDYDIPITAKEEYLGGNVVPSNGENSQVTLTEKEENIQPVLEFPRPYVNVQTSIGEEGELTETIFVEEQASIIDAIIEQLSKWTTETVKAEDISSKDGGTTYTWNYDYSWSDDKKVREGEMIITVDQIDASSNAADKVTTDSDLIKGPATASDIDKTAGYTLTFTYTPDENTIRNSSLEGAGLKPDNKADEDFDLGLDSTNGDGIAVEVDNTANYYVKVIAGTINIKKWIDDLINTDRAGDAIFQFKIEKTDDIDDAERVWYRTVRIGEGTSTEGVGSEAAAEAVNKILAELPRGTYAITELSSMRYEYVDAAVKTGVEATLQDKGHIEVVIGYDADGSTKNNDNTDAVVVFENKADGENHSTDTDVVINEFEVVNGVIQLVEGTGANGGNYLGGTEPTVKTVE